MIRQRADRAAAVARPEAPGMARARPPRREAPFSMGIAGPIPSRANVLFAPRHARGRRRPLARVFAARGARLGIGRSRERVAVSLAETGTGTAGRRRRPQR